jgi:hypothetical protein
VWINRKRVIGALSGAFVFVAVNVAALSAAHRLNLDRQRNLMQATWTSSSDVRYDVSTGENLSLYWSHVPDASNTRLVLLSGMSQMYAINNRRPGDLTIAERMDDELRHHSARVFGLASPNMNNEEALLLLLSAAANSRTKPAVFVYGVCFDKFRNVDVRVGLQKFLVSHPAALDNWRAVAVRERSAFPLATEKMLKTLADMQQDRATGPDTSVEGRVRSAVASLSPLVRERLTINAWVQSELFLLRNWALRIKPTSKRPVIRQRFELNWQFLELMNHVAQRENMRLVAYVIPLNPRAENPYVTSEYVDFKRRLEAFCQSQAIPFANFENIVPADDWGEFMGGPDFKHFKGAGHRITAQAILNTFGPILRGEQ